MPATKILSVLTAAALAIMGTAASATTISAVHTITQSGTADSVSSTTFYVTTAGFFDIYTDGPTIDPVLYLFEDTTDDGVLDRSDPLVGRNDDGCNPSTRSFCSPAGSFFNSLLEGIYLEVGTYVAAVSDFSFSEREARRGVNGRLGQTQSVGDVTTVITSTRYGTTGGVASFTAPPVPLPASAWMMLAGLGVLTIGAWARKQRA